MCPSEAGRWRDSTRMSTSLLETDQTPSRECLAQKGLQGHTRLGGRQAGRQAKEAMKYWAGWGVADLPPRKALVHVQGVY